MLWFEKYRPKTISEYIFHDPILREKCSEWIAAKSIPHLLLAGQPGTGKTALALLLITAMDLDESDILTINASTERGVDMIRDKIVNFAATSPMGKFKIVHLEEADRLTPEAQDAMRRFTEEKSDVVRFIMSCNHSNKIIPPLHSRFHEFTFKTIDKIDATEYIATILAKEKVKFTIQLVDKYVESCYPDIRKMVNTVQQYSINGVLREADSNSTSFDYNLSLLPLLQQGEIMSARKLVCANIPPDELENVYRVLYDNIELIPKFKDVTKCDEAIFAIADHLYRHTFVADPEINLAALFIRLQQI